MPAGRPTKYDPAICARVVEMMAEGASRTEVCADLDICYETFQRWQVTHPDFSEAVKKGLQLCQAWWEREGRKNLKDRDFSYTGWYMNMKNRFGWQDKQSTELTGPGGGPLQVQQVHDLTREELMQIAAKYLPAGGGEGNT